MERLPTATLALLLCLDLGAQALPEPQIPSPRAIHTKDTVTLAIIGDVMMHSRQLEYDCREFLSGISGLLKEADFAIANAEFSLGGRPYSGYPAFSAPDSYAEYLRDGCGIDVFLTANNHILDRGRKGLERTLHVYDSLGVPYCGSSPGDGTYYGHNPLMLFKDGIRIALLNFTYGTNFPAPASAEPLVGMLDKDEVSECIRRARIQGADFIIALPHWGREYSLTHDDSQRDWAEWLAGQGVDAIVGSHPHVVQDSCRIGGVPVIYSTGNAVSNMSARNTRLGLAVTLTLVVDRASGDKACTPRLHFTWCTLPGMLGHGYRTINIREWVGRRGDWLTPSDYDNMLETLERVCTATSIANPLSDTSSD